MVLWKEYTFLIEKHPFYGLKLKVLRNNKPISSYSSNLSPEIRTILRKTLSHKDISEDLKEWLEDIGNKMTIKIKDKYQVYDCQYNPDKTHVQKWTFSLDDDQVTLAQESQTNMILPLSDTFCYFKDTQELGHIIYEKTQKTEIDNKAWKKWQKKVLPNKPASMPRYEFNQLPIHLSTKDQITQFYFKENGQLMSPKSTHAKLELSLHYTEEDPLVQLQLWYVDQDQRWLYPLHLYHYFDKLCCKTTWGKRQAKAILTWLQTTATATETRKERLITHHLPKRVPNTTEQAWLKKAVSAAELPVFHLSAINKQWLLNQLNPVQEQLCCLGLRLLFSSVLQVDDSDSVLTLDKTHVNTQLPALKKLCQILDINLVYEKKPIHIKDQHLHLDLSKFEEGKAPVVYLDNQQIDIESLVSMKEKLWTSISQDAIEILDPDLIKKCEHILSIHHVQKTHDTPEQDNIPFQRTLHLLDWIQLRTAGVHITLSESQEALVKSFVSFSTLASIQLPKKLASSPRDYQHLGLNWLAFLYKHQLGAVLADDMGLGKTYQSLMLLGALHEKIITSHQQQSQHLIVVPPSLMYNWYHECERFYPEFNVSLYMGPKRSLDIPANIIITSYDLLRRDSQLISEKQFDIIIFDESQFIKNAQSARSKAAQQLKRSFTLCLTGTPIENHVGEYITIMNTALPGFLPKSERKIETLSQSQLEMIIRRSKPFILRRLKSQISEELPPKTEETIYLDMTSKQRQVYQSVIQATKKKLQEKDKKKNNQTMILAALMRLRQICVSPYLIDPSFDEITPKISHLMTILSNLKDEGHSALVFSQFLGGLDLIQAQCKEKNIETFRLDGSVPIQERKRMIEAFQSDDKSQVFLMSLKAGGFGLNLTKASYVFHIDPWWNPAVENQATDRVHRLGQSQHVFSYKLTMHDSIEEKILKIKEKKQELFKSLLDDSEIVNRKQALSNADILDLLS